MTFDPSDIELEPLRPTDPRNFSSPVISEMVQLEQQDTEHTEPEHHHRASFDRLLLRPSPPSSDSGSDSEPAETDRLLDHEDLAEPRPAVARRRLLPTPAGVRPRAFFIRGLALLCVCSLGIGSHYASYVLGPLKSRLAREMGTSNTEFSLLISAFSLNSTWTPLLGGVLANSLGTTFTSILATGVILLGQVILLIGDIWGSVRLMALGMFVFGLGISPLAVVQETIIVRFFKSHGLGVSMAFGLIAGKGASFISARTSYPLTEHFGTRAPFFVATFLAGMSVVVNLTYITASKWLVDGAGAELEAADIDEEARRRSVHNMSEAQALEKVAAKRRVHLKDVAKLGDVFWAYIGLNVIYGTIGSPFTHLAANIIEKRYRMTEEDAANQASYLLAGSLVLYPVCGYLVDRYKHQPIVVQLLTLSSSLTLFSYAWLALPPLWTHTSLPAIAMFGAGHGISPLLLVVLVPKIVPLKYVSTALGAHKSLEQTGSTIFQTLAGLALDMHGKISNPTIPSSPTIPEGGRASDSSIQTLLNIFFLLNVLQLLGIMGLAHLQRQKSLAQTVRHRASFPQNSDHQPDVAAVRKSFEPPEEPSRLMSPDQEHRPLELSEPSGCYSSTSATGPSAEEVRAQREARRGGIFAAVCTTLIISAWVLFLGTAWFRLGMKKGEDSVIPTRRSYLWTYT